MAAHEEYDYLSTISPDVDVTLSLKARGNIVEEGAFKVTIHEGDDGVSEERIIQSTTPKLYASFPYNFLNESDAGTVMDIYFNSVNGMGRTFKWLSGDGHTYVVRFNGKWSRQRLMSNARNKIPNILFRVLGRIAD